MRRTQIQLPERSLEALRTRAFREGISLSGVIRKLVEYHLAWEHTRRRRALSDFGFIASGRSRGPGARRVSANHDAELAQVML